MTSTDSIREKINSIIARTIRARRIPGAAVLLLKGREIAYEGYFGWANLDTHQPVQPDIAFAIASMTKAFTAAGILLLANEGKLNIHDPIHRYLPEVPDSWSEITIRRLFDHTSGLPEDWAEHAWGADRFFEEHDSKERFLEALTEEPLRFQPGYGWLYSCSPFLGALIIERITQQSYGGFMNELIFQPLGMHQTWIDDGRPAPAKPAAGYVIENDVIRPGYPVSQAGRSRGDVGVVTTARDLAVWFQAVRERRLIGKDGTAEMLQPARLQSGSWTPTAMGWFVVPVHGTCTIGHPGGLRTGYASSIDWYPQEDLALIILTNLGTDVFSYEEIQEILGVLDPNLAPIRTRERIGNTIRDAPPDLVAAIQAAASGRPHPRVHPNFPAGFHSPGSNARFASISAIQVLEKTSPPGGNVFFEVEVAEILFVKALAQEIFYTSLYLDGNGRLVYLDWPENISANEIV